MRVEDIKEPTITDKQDYADEFDQTEEIEESAGHDIQLSIGMEPEEELIVGQELGLQLYVSCPSACDFVDKTIKIINEGGVVLKEVALVEFDGVGSITEAFEMPVPDELGEYTWKIVFDPTEEETIHDAVSETISFVVKPHPTSMSIWDIDSPIVAGEEFSITVGVKCHADCSLANREIRVYDHTGTQVAIGVLGSELYSDDIDLYWTSVKLRAPQEIGDYTWDVKFLSSDFEIPHTGSDFSFPFSTTKAAECWLTVKVIDKESGNPINNAQVAIRPNLRTCQVNDDGEIKVGLPKGEHRIDVSAGKLAPEGLPYKIGEVPRVTRGYEYMVFVPEENRETLQNYRKELDIEEDTTIVVELVGVVEPPEDSTL